VKRKPRAAVSLAAAAVARCDLERDRRQDRLSPLELPLRAEQDPIDGSSASPTPAEDGQQGLEGRDRSGPFGGTAPACRCQHEQALMREQEAAGTLKRL
jgi:hypothetical protein